MLRKALVVFTALALSAPIGLAKPAKADVTPGQTVAATHTASIARKASRNKASHVACAIRRVPLILGVAY